MTALGNHILNSKINGRDLRGMTFEEILLKSKEFDYYRNPSDDEFRMRDRFDTILLDKTSFIRYRRTENGKFLMLEMRFENKSDKAIKTEIGSLGVPGLGLNDLENLSVIFDNVIEPKETKVGFITIPYNPFNRMQKSSSEWSEDVKFRWLPTKIIFEDGSEY